jgi:serine/threonine-protein kinase
MMASEAAPDLSASDSTFNVGRYVLHRQIARGGMATIHIARLMGDEGFSRIVAAKRLLPEFAEDPEFVAMFLDEARVASRVHHRNVVPVLDVVTTGHEVVLVQEYIHGAPLHWLLNKARQTKTPVPLGLAVSIACQVLAGLHAAHETVDEMGTPLDVVHRDVSPQNVMIAADGTARLLDFGVAKSLMAAHVTREGTYKGKLAYSAPEQLRGAATRQSDIYSLTVLLWELVVGHRMHRTPQAEAELVATIMKG